MKYKILRTDKAEDQLRDIIFYIADSSGNVDIALAYLDKIETAINRLTEFSMSGRAICWQVDRVVCLYGHFYWQ